MSRVKLENEGRDLLKVTESRLDEITTSMTGMSRYVVMLMREKPIEPFWSLPFPLDTI